MNARYTHSITLTQKQEEKLRQAREQGHRIIALLMAAVEKAISVPKK